MLKFGRFWQAESQYFKLIECKTHPIFSIIIYVEYAENFQQN